MRLSAPIFRLKKQARILARAENIPLYEALNQIAKTEGFVSWSQLSAHFKLHSTTGQILDQLSPGDFVLLAARPYQGKTTMALSLLGEAFRNGGEGLFFSLDLNEVSVRSRFKDMDINWVDGSDRMVIDTSDDISASYIINQYGGLRSGTLVVIDYLQILDQRRDKPELSAQVDALKTFAKTSGAIIIMISQVNRRYELSSKSLPDVSDLHLPNPIDLSVFTKTCFLGDGTIQLDATASPPPSRTLRG
ncbi:MAG: DNA helicase [Pseudomonadota bacterium]